MARDQPQDQHQLSRQVAKAATSLTLGGTLAVLSALTLAATVVGLVLATPPMVVFSPVLVPAAIAAGLIVAGFLASGGFGAAAAFVFYWVYKYAAGKHPMGADQLDRIRQRIGGAATELKGRAERFGQ